MAYLENDFISPINYIWPWITQKTTSLAQLLYMNMAYFENDFISPILYTWPWLTKKTTSLAQLFIHAHG